MAQDNYELIPAGDPISKSGIGSVLANIRPAWQGKNLIQRVERLLQVDPSSACQRLFNAAIHDLKDKIIVMGVDLAKQTANNNRLPPITKDEDIQGYPTSKTVDLAYYIGILSRPEWGRLHRCYQIRRDLEHEDNEYEAVLQDCFYIFKTTIDVVLSKDPIEIVNIVDVKELIESPDHISVSEEFLIDFKGAPKLRQLDILKLLVAYAYDDHKPDIVRENSVELMRKISHLTENTVVIEIAKSIEERIGRGGIDIKAAKIAYACGAIAYFKKVKIKDFYNRLLIDLKDAVGDWAQQGKVCRMIEDIGGLKYCPDELYRDFVLNLVVYYIGERSYGPHSGSRPVFFSNSAAPVIARLIQQDASRASDALEHVRKAKAIRGAVQYLPVLRRFEKLVDLTEMPEETS